MKRKILLISVLFFIGFNLNTSFAATDSWVVNVRVTEKIPWANCSEARDKTTWDILYSWDMILYDCKVKKGVSQIIDMLWNIIKYFTYIASLAWVLFIVYNGILYSMWWIEDSLKDWAKKRIIWTLIWLLILFLSWPLLQLIAPWIYK